MYSVEVKNVSKSLGKNSILENDNFNLEKGKIYGLVGANGSGKSTLLKIILGLYKSKGKVYINGYDVKKNFKEAISKVSGVVDYVSLYEFFNAKENLRYFAYLYDVPVKRVDEVLDIVKLDGNDRKLVRYYSLGMKQKLGIAISLLKDPDILILDEPTNHLDISTREILEETGILLNDKEIIKQICTIEYLNKNYPRKDNNRLTKFSYYYVVTDKKVNLNNTNYDEWEKKNNFKLKYVFISDFEKVLNETINDNQMNKMIYKDMMLVFNLLKKEI